MANIVSSALDKLPRSFKDFASKVLASQTGAPVLALSEMMDTLFQEEQWFTFDYETVEQSLISWGLPRPSSMILDQLQAISALRMGRSFIDKEWNLFEKASAAFSGIPVFFYEKQNIPIENVAHAIKLMSKLGAPEYSEEVKHYIGCEAVNDEILWHPDSFIDSCITFALDNLKGTVAIPDEDIQTLRADSSKKFTEYTGKDLKTAIFDPSSPVDMMCSRVIRSLLSGKNLLHLEVYFLNVLNTAKAGTTNTEGIDEETQKMLTQRMQEPENFDNGPEMSEVEMITPDMIPSSYEFDESVKVAFAKELQDAHVYKTASIPGVPITTGVPSTGMIYGRDDPNRHLEQTEPIEGTAEEKMLKSLDEAAVDRPKTNRIDDKREDEDGFLAFKL